MGAAESEFGKLTDHVNAQTSKAHEAYTALTEQVEAAVQGLGEQVDRVAIAGYNKLLEAVRALHQEATDNLAVIAQNQGLIQHLCLERNRLSTRITELE